MQVRRCRPPARLDTFRAKFGLMESNGRNPRPRHDEHIVHLKSLDHHLSSPTCRSALPRPTKPTTASSPTNLTNLFIVSAAGGAPRLAGTRLQVRPSIRRMAPAARRSSPPRTWGCTASRPHRRRGPAGGSDQRYAAHTSPGGRLRPGRREKIGFSSSADERPGLAGVLDDPVDSAAQAPTAGGRLQFGTSIVTLRFLLARRKRSGKALRRGDRGRALLSGRLSRRPALSAGRSVHGVGPMSRGTSFRHRARARRCSTCRS